MSEQTQNQAQEQNLLNKGIMVERMLERYGADFASKAAADRIVRGVFSMMAEHLAAGGTVRIQDFGTFETVEASARKGRNPQTKEDIEIPACTRVKFRAAAALKAAANK